MKVVTAHYEVHMAYVKDAPRAVFSELRVTYAAARYNDRSLPIEINQTRARPPSHLIEKAVTWLVQNDGDRLRIKPKVRDEDEALKQMRATRTATATYSQASSSSPEESLAFYNLIFASSSLLLQRKVLVLL